jgi:outer membrane protein OmpA-like peptidoglycan-associated protein
VNAEYGSYPIASGTTSSDRASRAAGCWRTFAVLKFLLTALVTAAVGIHALESLGLAVSVPLPRTYVVGNVLGGLVFGVGMALAGFCPGTIAAGAGEGRLDYVIPGDLGLYTGAVVFGVACPRMMPALSGWAREGEVRRAHAAAEARARLYRDLALRLKTMVDAGDLSIALREGRMVLQLPSDVLFESGRVDIRPRGQAALKLVAAVLKTLDGRHFQIAGHTDNVPIETVRYPSNWELSTARGVEVVRFLTAQGVAPAVLAAAGYGEFDPVAPNDDAKGRARNRRIEITLQPNVDEIVSVPDGN